MMSTFETIWKVLQIVLCALALAVAIFIFKKVPALAEGGCNVLEYPLKLLKKPFSALETSWKNGWSAWRLRRRLSRDAIARFADRHPTIGTAWSIRVALISLVFLMITLIWFGNRIGYGEYCMELFFMLPLGVFVQLLNGDLSFSMVTLLSAGFSGLLIKKLFDLCMDEYSFDESFGHRVMSVVYYAIMTMSACSIGLLLSNVWEGLASFGVSLYQNMAAFLSGVAWSFVGVLEMIGVTIGLLLLLYIAAIMLMIALQEYWESLCYGISCALVFIAVAVSLSLFIPGGFWDTVWGDTVELSGVFLCLFVTDYLRVYNSSKKTK